MARIAASLRTAFPSCGPPAVRAAVWHALVHGHGLVRHRSGRVECQRSGCPHRRARTAEPAALQRSDTTGCWRNPISCASCCNARPSPSTPGPCCKRPSTPMRCRPSGWCLGRAIQATQETVSTPALNLPTAANNGGLHHHWCCIAMNPEQKTPATVLQALTRHRVWSQLDLATLAALAPRWEQTQADVGSPAAAGLAAQPHRTDSGRYGGSARPRPGHGGPPAGR